MYLRFLLDLTKSLSISSVIKPNVSIVFGEDIEGVAISTPINCLLLNKFDNHEL